MWFMGTTAFSSLQLKNTHSVNKLSFLSQTIKLNSSTWDIFSDYQNKFFFP